MIINDTLGVVVLHEIKVNESTSLKTLNNTLTDIGKLDVLVYDHSLNSAENLNNFENLELFYKHDSRNLSLGIAYNYAAKIARNLGKKWLLLLDQDTLLSEDLFFQYESYLEKFPNEFLFAPILKLSNGKIFSPCRYFFKRGFLMKKIEPGIHNLNYISPVNSGMLIRLNNYIACGGYNENVKLDFSDFQFIERFRQFNRHFVVTNSVGIQDFSNSTTDVEKLDFRYSIYCQSAKNCNKKNWFEKLQYMIIVLQRCITLSIRTKNKKYFQTFIQNYIK
ncbi:MAG: hypothetical protein PHS59_10665 [Paludibacter sp.]|nr:hypothetical protein [Paludibacter sp.]